LGRTAPSKSGYALAQTAEGPNALFNLCVAEGTSFKDVDVSIAFKASTGKTDQGGGVGLGLPGRGQLLRCPLQPLEGNYRIATGGMK
jgi:hypothetical protein